MKERKNFAREEELVLQYMFQKHLTSRDAELMG